MEIISEILRNGIRVHIARMKGFSSSSVGFWIAVGSRDDPKGKRGITHLLEHLLFKGSSWKSASDIAKIIDRIGGGLDGCTEREITVIWAKTLNRYFIEAVDLICELVFYPSFAPEDLEREKRIVLEEIKIYEDDPEESGYDELIRAIVGKHPIGNPILGVWEEVEGIGYDDVLSHWADSYSTSRILISAAGPIEPKELIRTIEGKVPDKISGKGGERSPIIPKRSHLDMFLERDGFEETYFFLGTLGASRKEMRRRIALDILSTAIAGGASSRLFMEIREKMSMVYNISSSSTSFTDLGIFDISFSCRRSLGGKVLELVERQIEGIRSGGFERDEVERAKSVLESSIIMDLESPEGMMRWLGYFGLLDGYIPDGEEIISLIGSVREEEVSSIAREILDPDRISKVVVGGAERIGDRRWRRRQG